MIDFCPNYIITLVTGADPLKFLTSSNYLVAGKTPMAKKFLSEVCHYCLCTIFYGILRSALKF